MCVLRLEEIALVLDSRPGNVSRDEQLCSEQIHRQILQYHGMKPREIVHQATFGQGCALLRHTNLGS